MLFEDSRQIRSLAVANVKHLSKPQVTDFRATERMQVAHCLKHQSQTNHNIQRKSVFLILIFLNVGCSMNHITGVC